MPIIVEADVRRRLIITTVYGTVRDEDLLQHVAETWKKYDRSTWDELMQSRGDLRVRATPAGIRKLVALVGQLTPAAAAATHRLAIVTRMERGRELADLYHTLVTESHTEARLFDSYADALRWLRPETT
jgi:hypothetical protein